MSALRSLIAFIVITRGVNMTTTIRTGFKPSELKLPYDEWCNLLKDEGLGSAPPFVSYPDANMTKELRGWLHRWHSLDLAWSPMPDEERRQLRLGHFFGYFDALDIPMDVTS
jgi:hypothetical protein